MAGSTREGGKPANNMGSVLRLLLTESTEMVSGSKDSVSDGLMRATLRSESVLYPCTST